MIDIDPVIHAPKRLAAMAVLVSAPTVTFRFLRDHLDLRDSDLSKQMSALEAAGYVEVLKSGHGRGSATTYRATPAGRGAYQRHVAVLRGLIDGPGPDAARSPSPPG